MFGRHSSLALCGFVCVLLVSGCADTAHTLQRMASRPFRKSTEEIYGIKTPKQRVEEFRKLAKSAKALPPEKQTEMVFYLTREYDGESDGWVRREILRAIAPFPQPESGALLVRALDDPQVETRSVACIGLGIRGDAIAVRELSRVLGSETDIDVRLAAVDALGKADDKAALPSLAEALADSDPAMQAEAYMALTSVSGKDYGNNVQAWREFAQNGKTDAKEISLAEKLRRNFY